MGSCAPRVGSLFELPLKFLSAPSNPDGSEKVSGSFLETFSSSNSRKRRDGDKNDRSMVEGPLPNRRLRAASVHGRGRVRPARVGPASLGPVHGGSLRNMPQIRFAIILCESEPAISAGYFCRR